MILQQNSRHFIKALNSSFHTRYFFNMPSPPNPYAGLNVSWPFPDFRKSQKYWRIKSQITIFLVGVAGKTLLTVFNRAKVHNKEVLVDAVFKRPSGVPLITVANHESCMDDPALIGLALSPMQLMDQKKMRWSLAAHDICFTKPLHASFFSLGKCVPIVRGMGVYQKPVDFAIERLNEFGDWFHIFPEGKVNTEREKLYRFKWGIGRIISELKTTPIVIPFYHTGMPDVLPNQRPYIPRYGNKVFMNVGEPLNIQPVLDSITHFSPRDKRKVITDFIQLEMEKLRHVTLKLSQEYHSGTLNV
ncbi:unnamed protein product [Orchesella dallaii]|uniref:Tafazzin family protein n=1 Tax=Orchesella dallaii TaxID=48710 RepID=A0ABP1QA89_9HEXA